MKKIYIIFAIVTLFICCKKKATEFDPIFLDLRLQCHKIFYADDEAGFNVAFQISYENNSEYNFFFQDTIGRIVSSTVTDYSKGFVLKNTGKKNTNIILTDLDNKCNYIQLKPNVHLDYFYIYMRGNYSVKKSINDIQEFHIQYNGGNLNSNIIPDITHQKAIILNMGNLKIDLNNAILKKVKNEDLIYQKKLDQM